MAQNLALRRSSEDKRRFDLPGVGSLQLPRWPSRATLATPIEGAALTLVADRRACRAFDTAEREVGTSASTMRRNLIVAVRWHDTEYELRALEREGTVYILSASDRDLAVIQPHGRRSGATIGVGETSIDPSLLLYVIWLAQRFREQAIPPAAIDG